MRPSSSCSGAEWPLVESAAMTAELVIDALLMTIWRGG
jgi:hypothetical protein